MKKWLALVLVLGILVGMGVSTLMPSVAAQRAPSLRDMTGSGFGVEEVIVGTSCVVIVWRGGAMDAFQAVPCASRGN